MHLNANSENQETQDFSTPGDKEEKAKNETKVEKSPSHLLLESCLNKNMKIEMTDGRVLVGIFLCTDKDRNVILGSCAEYLKFEEGETNEEPRVLGLAMVPGHHIVSIHVDSEVATTPSEEVL